MTVYKVLNKDGRSCNGGDLLWSLPVQNDDVTWTPGDWMPAIEGELIPCENGYHLAVDVQVLVWLNERIFEAEYRGERIDGDEKIVVRECRLLREFTGWNERTAHLFAVWNAREALKFLANPDPRSVAACDVAERYANGEATSEELAAARAAAWDAAWDAAWAAARDAAWDAAWVAARAAAWDAARDAAWDAARAAARDAAWDAARAAARAAAGDAAGDAAWAAAWDAAWAAARAAQYGQFASMVG